MPQLNQKGFIAQLFIFLLLLAGLAVGIYLVQNRTTLFSKASGGGVSQPITPAVGLTVESDFGTYVGQEVAVSIMARSDFDSANLFAAKLKFNKDLLRVSKIDTNTGFIKNWVEEHYDNDTGEISLVGGIPNPGIQTQIGSAGQMALIYFVALKEGKADISFTNESAIYRNYDNSNVIGFKKGATITIQSPVAQITPPPPPPPSTVPITISPPVPITQSSGDMNGDGKVNLVDMSRLLAKFGQTGKSEADMNGDGIMNTIDVLLLRNILINNGVLKTK